MPTELDFARLAAYLDGEGCIRIGTCKSKKWKREHLYAVIVVTGTDPRLTQWCKETFGVGSIKGHSNNSHKNPNWKPCFFWTVACRQAVDLLSKCLPFFIIKREQAEVVISFASTLKRWGVKGAPAEVIQKQYELKTEIHKLNRRGPDTVQEQIIN